MCQKKYPKLVSNSFFLPYPYPLDTSQFLQHYSVEGTLIIGGEEIWRWELHHLETWSPGAFQSSSSPDSTSLGCSRCSFTAGGPARIWRLWAGAEGSRHAGLWGRAHWPAHLSQLCRPTTVHLGTQASGMCQQPRSPRPEGNRVSMLFL